MQKNTTPGSAGARPAINPQNPATTATASTNITLPVGLDGEVFTIDLNSPYMRSTFIGDSFKSSGSRWWSPLSCLAPKGADQSGRHTATLGQIDPAVFAVYVTYTSNGELNIDMPTRTLDLQRIIQCLQLGKLIDDAPFSAEAMSLLTSLVEDLVPSHSVPATPCFNEVIGFLSDFDPQTLIQAGACTLLVKLVATELHLTTSEEPHDLREQIRTAEEKAEIAERELAEASGRMDDLKTILSEHQNFCEEGQRQIESLNADNAKLKTDLRNTQGELDRVSRKAQSDKKAHDLEILHIRSASPRHGALKKDAGARSQPKRRDLGKVNESAARDLVDESTTLEMLRSIDPGSLTDGDESETPGTPNRATQGNQGLRGTTEDAHRPNTSLLSGGSHKPDNVVVVSEEDHYDDFSDLPPQHVAGTRGKKRKAGVSSISPKGKSIKTGGKDDDESSRSDSPDLDRLFTPKRNARSR